MPEMKAAVFVEPGRIVLDSKPVPEVGVYSSDLRNHRIVTSLCPGGKERMRRLISVIAAGRVDLKGTVNHRHPLHRIAEARELFAHRRDGVLKAAITA